MTKAQRHEHKYGNAVRAVKGIWRKKFVKGGGYTFAPFPQPDAQSRVDRWAFRMKQRGQALPQPIVWTR